MRSRGLGSSREGRVTRSGEGNTPTPPSNSQTVLPVAEAHEKIEKSGHRAQLVLGHHSSMPFRVSNSLEFAVAAVQFVVVVAVETEPDSLAAAAPQLVVGIVAAGGAFAVLPTIPP